MVRATRIISIILLLINGISACFGGLALIIDPDGRLLGMSLSGLRFSPFITYLVPGIVLLLMNGISSLFIAFLTILKFKPAPTLVVLQGIILLGWIIIEALFVDKNFLQFVFGTIGIILIGMGRLLSRLKLS